MRKNKISIQNSKKFNSCLVCPSICCNLKCSLSFYISWMKDGKYNNRIRAIYCFDFIKTAYYYILRINKDFCETTTRFKKITFPLYYYTVLRIGNSH